VRMWIGRSGGRPAGRPPRVRGRRPSIWNAPSEKCDGRSLRFVGRVNNHPTARPLSSGRLLRYRTDMIIYLTFFYGVESFS
jgi:hypothetical protein